MAGRAARLILSLAALVLVTGQAPPGPFVGSEQCIACHNGLSSAAGEDVSIGSDWRASIMAHSARDPYWQAAVRRELIDHPGHAREIEDECSICHMPMTTHPARSAGGKGQLFAHLAAQPREPAQAALAADGVSCSVCHQIEAERLGQKESFTGRFVVGGGGPGKAGQRVVYGPFEVEPGVAHIMRSATGFAPQQGKHVQSSELCATCHTLYTRPLGTGGAVEPFPEQVPYLEWLHSDFRRERSCQGCHMPVVEGAAKIASVWSEPREGLSRHSFRGANFFMLRMLSRYRDELGVPTLPQELDASAMRTVAHLQNETARLEVSCGPPGAAALEVQVRVRNLAGHKLPTAYPSRRVWLQVTVRDPDGKVLFESGALRPDGSIVGNDNDVDPRRYEPHHPRIDSAEQVQIYESILGTPDGAVTTGLLAATQYLKDNRLLPRGFDKATAPPDVRVRGAAAGDADFLPESDLVRYAPALGGAASRGLRVEAQLWYQPIAFRWAMNLQAYDAPEPRRFLGYFRAMSGSSALRLVSASAACGGR